MNVKLGIQSWCFREFKTTEELIRGLQLCDSNCVELCSIHLNQDSPKETLQQLQKAKISINSYGVHYFTKDESAARKIFEFAQLANFPSISADFDIEALPMLEKLCEEYSKKLAIHNHGRKHHFGSVRELEKIFNRSSKNIGLCLDTAWMLDSGEDPLDIAKKFQDRLYGTHIKDFIFDRSGNPKDVIVGSGNLNLSAYMLFLHEINYNGYLTLEYEGNASNPISALAECSQIINKLKSPVLCKRNIS
ncbi:MAG: sugar phosphate isomerase/epimerase [Lentisphaeria bacterium]